MPSSPGPNGPSVIDVRSCAVASRTDVGSTRTQNQDACAALQRPDGARLLVVADGMGGHRGGATASRLAVEALSEAFVRASRGPVSPFSCDWLAAAIRQANRDVHAAAEADPELRGMGTTLVSALLDIDGRGYVAHVGDSRAYLSRAGELERLTEDHSVVAEMQRRGMLTRAEAERHPRRNEILRSVGVDAEVEVDTRELDLEPGDALILCSDGLCGVLDDAEIQSTLTEIAAASGSGDVDRVVDEWIARANAAGGPDNITAQLLCVPSTMLAASDALPQDAGNPGHTGGAGSYAALGMLGLGIAGLVAFAWILWN